MRAAGSPSEACRGSRVSTGRRAGCDRRSVAAERVQLPTGVRFHAPTSVVMAAKAAIHAAPGRRGRSLGTRLRGCGARRGCAFMRRPLSLWPRRRPSTRRRVIGVVAWAPACAGATPVGVLFRAPTSAVMAAKAAIHAAPGRRGRGLGTRLRGCDARWVGCQAPTSVVMAATAAIPAAPGHRGCGLGTRLRGCDRDGWAVWRRPLSSWPRTWPSTRRRVVGAVAWALACAGATPSRKSSRARRASIARSPCHPLALCRPPSHMRVMSIFVSDGHALAYLDEGRAIRSCSCTVSVRRKRSTGSAPAG